MLQKSSFLLFLMLSVLPCVASVELLPPELEHHREHGVDALFNMDYPRARSSFENMIEDDPKHPAGYIYLANTIWLGQLAELRRLQTNVYNRGNSFFSKTEDAVDPKIDKEFREKIDKGISLAENYLKSHKDDVSTLYYLGVAKNIVAGYEATVKRSFLPALKSGSKGVGFHRELMKKHPEVIDAQLSVGMYNYVVGSLPLAVKILAFIGGVHGSKKDGIAMLERVARDGNYAKDEGKVLLVMLYNREKRLSDGLNVLNGLVSRYPGNTLFRLERAVTLGQLKKFEESSKEFEAMIQDPVVSAYIPDLVQYQYATMLFDAARWQQSYDHFMAASKSTKAPDAVVTLSLLNAAKALDAIGRRNEAISLYQSVLKRKDVFDSRDTAKKFVKQPFRP
jgi:tetratricopeptide (TPR) repeat protein